MISISRTFTVAAPADAVLEYLRDFGNTNEWDPATQQATRIGGGPLTVGASWHHTSKVLGVRTELTYTLQAATGDRLVFTGHSEGATTTGTIAVRPVADGTEVTYQVQLEVHGLAQLATPVLRIELEKLGDATAAQLTSVLNRHAAPAPGRRDGS
jgi:carbon monoxide dehydrogenase subunit G